MADYSIPVLGAVAATFFVAGIVKGVSGMGLPTVAMGMLGTLLSPLAAASLLIVPSFVTNIWQLFAGPNFWPLARRLWPMMLAIVVGTLVGTSLLTDGNVQVTTKALGAALVVYATYTLAAKPLSVPVSWERWASPIIGAATGLVTGATGVFVIPAVPYLQALDFQKDDLVQALGLSFTVSTIALALGLAGRGAYQTDSLVMSALAVIPALLGMWAGQAIRSRISQATFRLWFLVCLLLLGIELMVKPLG